MTPINMPDVWLQIQQDGFIVGLNHVGDTLDNPTGGVWGNARTAGQANINIKRGHQASGISGYGPGTATLTFVDRDGIWNYPTYTPARTGATIQVREPVSGTPIYTGNISDLTYDYSPLTGATIMTIACVDATAILDNHTLYGMQPPAWEPLPVGLVTAPPTYGPLLPTSETFQSRINRIAARTPVPFANSLALTPPNTTHTLASTATSNTTGRDLTLTSTKTSNTTTSFTVETKPGTDRTGPLTGKLASTQTFTLNVTGPIAITGHILRTTGTADQLWDVVWTSGATTTSFTVESWEPVYGGLAGKFTLYTNIEPDEANTLELVPHMPAPSTWGAHPTTLVDGGLEGITFTTFTSAKRPLSATVYESSAANHLTLAADTVGAFWHVDKTNTVNVTWGETPNDPADYHFTDFGNTGVPYGDLVTRRATTTITNRFTVTNHSQNGPGAAENPNEANDTSHDAADTLSVILNGPREAQLDVNMWAPTPSDLENAIAIRSAEIFATRATPTYTPTSLRFRGHEHPTVASTIDLTQIITITSGATTHTCRVIGIDHDIDPYEWLVTLELEPVRNT